jgi:hypothetical protein
VTKRILFALAVLVIILPAAQAQAMCTGTSNPLSNTYSSLASAQAVYPFATSLSDEYDYAQLQLTINQNRPINLPSSSSGNPAVCVLNKQLTASGIGVTIRGASTTTQLYWPSTASSAGLNFTRTAGAQQINIHDVSLVSGQMTPFSWNAINIVNTAAAIGSADTWTVVIRNVTTTGVTPTTGWAAGIAMTDPMYITIDGFTHRGPYGLTGPNLRSALINAGAGILFSSTYGPSNPNDVTCCFHMKNLNISWVNLALYAEKNMEGIYLTDFIFLNVNTGIMYLGDASLLSGDHVIRAGHINALVAGAFVQYSSGMTIKDIMFFQNQLIDAATTSTGISLNGVQVSTFTDNHFAKFGPSYYTHISVGGSLANGVVFARNRHVGGDAGYFISAALPTTGDRFVIEDEVFPTFLGVPPATRYTGTTAAAVIRDFP